MAICKDSFRVNEPMMVSKIYSYLKTISIQQSDLFSLATGLEPQPCSSEEGQPIISIIVFLQPSVVKKHLHKSRWIFSCTSLLRLIYDWSYTGQSKCQKEGLKHQRGLRHQTRTAHCYWSLSQKHIHVEDLNFPWTFIILMAECSAFWLEVTGNTYPKSSIRSNRFTLPSNYVNPKETKWNRAICGCTYSITRFLQVSWR